MNPNDTSPHSIVKCPSCGSQFELAQVMEREIESKLRVAILQESEAAVSKKLQHATDQVKAEAARQIEELNLTIQEQSTVIEKNRGEELFLRKRIRQIELKESE